MPPGASILIGERQFLNMCTNKCVFTALVSSVKDGGAQGAGGALNEVFLTQEGVQVSGWRVQATVVRSGL